MPVGRLILLGILGLVVAEAAVFLLVAQLLGSLPALVLLFATSIFGAAVLGRMGRRLAGNLADMMSRRGMSPGNTAATEASGGLLTMIGGILLVLPGFLTDIAGLLLLVPSVQQKLIDAPRFRRTRPPGQVLDLDRGQWHDMPDSPIEDQASKNSRLNERKKAPTSRQPPG